MSIVLMPDDIAVRRETVLRMSRTIASTLAAHMRQDSHNEQMAFGLAKQVDTVDGTEFLLDELLLPGPEDLASQSAGGICPTRSCQGVIYLLAQQARKSIVEFHTHPGPGRPHFSSTDEHYGMKNAEYIRSHFPDPITLLMVVGNNRFDTFDVVVFDRKRGRFVDITRWENLGRPTSITVLGRDAPPAFDSPSGLFDRQQMIPGWNQEGLELQRIGILGAGGNGAPLIQLLAGIGAGRRGFIAFADPDTVEPSNLPRIPYACADHVGTTKVDVAADYVRRKSPGTPVFPFACKFSDAAVRRRMKMATILFHCGDNHGGRKEANDMAVRYGIPLIDLGCDIQVSKERVVAGGQVRLVLPGETACLVCCRGFDPAQAAIDQMSEASQASQAAQGYVVGAQAEATPSVANLNGFTVQYALSQFLALVNGPDFAKWDYLHFDQFTGRTIPANTIRDPECPQCGQTGYLLAGDPGEHKTDSDAKIRQWSEKVPPHPLPAEAEAQSAKKRKWWKRSKTKQTDPSSQES